MRATETVSYTSPPLTRGLAILEEIARAPAGLAFTDILHRIDAPRASVARLIRVLLSEGYVVKRGESGRYGLGPRMGLFAAAGSVKDRLQGVVRPLLEGVSEDTHNTSLFIYWSGEYCECLDKVMLPESISMQHVGTRNADLSVSPWGWAIYAELDDEHRRAVLSHVSDRRGFARDFKRHGAYYRSHRFAYDDCEHFAGVRRFGAPVFDVGGEVRGAMCLGASPLVVTDKAVARVGRRVAAASHELERLMGWRARGR